MDIWEDNGKISNIKTDFLVIQKKKKKKKETNYCSICVYYVFSVLLLWLNKMAFC